MTSKILFAAACVLAARTAWAQPADGQTPVPPPGDVTPPPTDQTPQPPQPPQPPHPTMVPREIAPEPPPPPALVRPEGFSIGIGVGYKFPTSLQTPNVSSVRLRLASGITLEPSVVFANTSHSVDMGMAATGSANELGVGVTARFPLMQRHRTDLEFLAAVDLDRVSTDPDDDNSDDVTTVGTTTLRYGLAVGAWITPHLEASMSATNGLVTYVKNRQEQGIDTVTVTTDLTFGVIWDPTVVFMLHLYN